MFVGAHGREAFFGAEELLLFVEAHVFDAKTAGGGVFAVDGVSFGLFGGGFGEEFFVAECAKEVDGFDLKVFVEVFEQAQVLHELAVWIVGGDGEEAEGEGDGEEDGGEEDPAASASRGFGFVLFGILTGGDGDHFERGLGEGFAGGCDIELIEEVPGAFEGLESVSDLGIGGEEGLDSLGVGGVQFTVEVGDEFFVSRRVFVGGMVTHDCSGPPTLDCRRRRNRAGALRGDFLWRGRATT